MISLATLTRVQETTQKKGEDITIFKIPDPSPSTSQSTSLSSSQSPANPILPTVNEIFWSVIFFVSFWMLMKYVLLPPIRAAQKRRTQKLESSKDTVESIQQEKVDLVNDYDKAIVNVHQEAVQLTYEVRQKCDKYRQQVISKVEMEIAEQTKRDQAELEVARQEAADLLVKELQGVTSKAVEVILGEVPNEKLVSEHINRLKV